MLDVQDLRSATSSVRTTLAAGQDAWDGLGEAEMLALLGTAADLSRAADALRVYVAGAVSRRSEGLSRAESLASRLGFRNTKSLLMQAFGLPSPSADALITVAQATAPRQGYSQGALPPFRPALAAGLRAGEVSLDQAVAVHRELPPPGAPEASPGMIDAAEMHLVAEATGGRVDLPRVEPTPGSAPRTAPTLGGTEGGDSSAGGTGSEAVGTEDVGTEDVGTRGPGANEDHGDHGEDSRSTHGPEGVLGAGNPAQRPPDRDRDVWGGRRLEVHHLRSQARLWASHIDPDGPEPRFEEQRQRRGFRLTPARGGGWTLSGFAPQDAGALMQSILDRYSSPKARATGAASAGGTTGASGGERDALDEATAWTDEGTHQDAHEAALERTADQANFDALHSLFEEHSRGAGASAGTGATTSLVVTVTLSDLDRFARTTGAEPSWPAGTARLSRSEQDVPLSAIATLLCEDAVWLLVTDDAGVPLAHGRTRRLFSHHQRRLLAVRDGRCKAPGCSAPPSWCHAHHVIPWEHGGTTDIDNGVLLCSFHHHELHRQRLVALPALAGASPRVVSILTARRLGTPVPPEPRGGPRPARLSPPASPSPAGPSPADPSPADPPWEPPSHSCAQAPASPAGGRGRVPRGMPVAATIAAPPVQDALPLDACIGRDSAVTVRYEGPAAGRREAGAETLLVLGTYRCMTRWTAGHRGRPGRANRVTTWTARPRELRGHEEGVTDRMA